MISYDVIVAAIEQHARQATGDEANIREQLSAIRALCDVVLDDTAKTTPQPEVKPVVQQPVIQQTPKPIMQQASILTKKIEEDDANGDSLFDF